MKKTISFILLFLSAITFAQVTDSVPRINVADMLNDGQAQLTLCFTNADFKANVDLSLLTTIDRIQRQDPDAVLDNGAEVCVDSSKVQFSQKDVADLRQRMGAVDKVELELVKPTASLSAEPVTVEKTTLGRQVFLTLRAAVTGAAGAAVIRAGRPALDYLSKKGTGDISLAAGAAIGVIADAVQRLNGETDETKIAQRNLGASLIGSMIQTRDPNVVGLAVVITLSQIPMIQKAVEDLAKSTPQKLSIVYPALMVGAFALIGHNRRGEQWKFNKDKVLGGATFGTLAAMVTAAHKGNETAGFIVASTASLLDELCDAATSKCKGKFSLADLAANTIGAYLGVKIGGLVVSKTRGGAQFHYYREFN